MFGEWPVSRTQLGLDVRPWWGQLLQACNVGSRVPDNDAQHILVTGV